MRRRWWLVVIAAVVFLGAAMPWSQPDAALMVVELKKRVADLERLVRSNATHSHNLRDLKDGNLFDAADGEVPRFDKPTGTYRPGTAGGPVGRVLAGSSVTTQNIGTGDDLLFDEVIVQSGSGITAVGSGFWALTAGVYDISAGVVIEPPGVDAGVMELYLRYQLTGDYLYKRPRQRVWWDVNEECYLNVSITGLEVFTSIELVAVAGQTNLPGLDALMNEQFSFLSIVKIA